MIRIIEKDGSTKDYEQSDVYALQALRHTGSHIMAEAVKRLYPNATITKGLAIIGTDAQNKKDSVKSEVDNWINSLNIAK